MREQYESGDTVQFTFVSSVTPDSNPRLAITNNSGTLISSATSQASAAGSYFAMMTMPGSADGVYRGEWYAAKTTAGDTFPFYKRFLFNVATTLTRD